ncbi:MAG: hypothetical protein ACI9WU_004748 [Myxococcota bacterium]|jgi:hypothetical protein
MIRLLLSVFIASLLFTGCGKRTPGPADSYRQFHKSLTKFAREPWATYRRQAFAMLSTPDQEHFQKQADALNAKLPQGVLPLEADQLLRVGSLKTSKPIDTIDVVEATADQATLSIAQGDTASTVTMVLEGAAWRVRLLTP